MLNENEQSLCVSPESGKIKSHVLAHLLTKINMCQQEKIGSLEIMNKIAILLKQFGKSGLSAVIKEIIKNESLLSEIASQSYLQGNGFYKIILAHEQNFNLRLHIWMPGIFSQENLHNHRWHLASMIITGTLHSEIWEDSVSPSAAMYDEYLYMGKESNPILIGKARIELLKKVLHKSDEAYTLPSHVLHRIISHEEMTSTLMFRPMNARDWSRNIALNSIPPKVQPTYMSPLELGTILEDYIIRINA